MKKPIKVGQTVTTDGDSGFTSPSEVKIKAIIIRYDSETGKPYDVYIIEDDQEFDGRTGWAITPPMAYYIKELQK